MSYDDMVSCLCHILVSHVCETAVVNCQELFHTMVKIDGINNQTM